MKLLALGLILVLGAVQETDGGKALVHVDKPPSKARPGAPLGLLLTFHGANGNENSLVPKAEEMLQKLDLRDDWVVIGLKSKEVGWTNKDDEPVKAFIPWAIKTYRVDPRRVFGFGVSSGAWYLNRFAPANSDLLAGCISYVGGLGSLPKTDAPKTHAEVYVVIGHKDPQPSPAAARPPATAFFKAGFRGVYREMLDHAHEGPKEPSQSDAIEWMRALRNKRVAPSAADAEFLAKFEGGKNDSALSTGSTWNRLATIGGHAAAPVVLQGLKSDRAGVRANAAKACTAVMFDDAVVDALVELVADKDNAVRKSVLAALAFQGRWHYAQAHGALCAVARDEKAAQGDRRAAAQGLAEIAKIDLLGTWLYKDIVWTLVDLLGDRDGGLRQIAFQALQPVHADALGYSPAMQEGPRAKALERWAAWAEKVCGPKPQ
jgi:predicted esterase